MKLRIEPLEEKIAPIAGLGMGDDHEDEERERPGVTTTDGDVNTGPITLVL